MNAGVLNGNSEIDGLSHYPSKRFRKPENVSILEHTRLRNIGMLLIVLRARFTE